MSTFAVTVEQIERVWAHPNADRLELASLKGMTYQFCVMKGAYAPGDTVIYFPIDSLLPAPLIEALGLTGKLHGKDKNRIATVKLRGEISQGVVMRPAEVLPGETITKNGHTVDLAERLGVTKYEAPEPSIKGGRLVRLPQMVSVYDIEGADRYPEIAGMLMDVLVSVTEKLEGSHFAASLDRDGNYAVCQRRYQIVTDDGQTHDWHSAAEEAGVRSALDQLWASYEPKAVITVRGEVVGASVQGNLYQMKKRKIYFYEVEVDGSPLRAADALAVLAGVGLCTVPVLAHGVTLREFLSGRSVTEASTGHTALPEAGERILREGIVIRPLDELQDTGFGRIIIKQRSPDYLAWSGL